MSVEAAGLALAGAAVGTSAAHETARWQTRAAGCHGGQLHPLPVLSLCLLPLPSGRLPRGAQPVVTVVPFPPPPMLAIVWAWLFAFVRVCEWSHVHSGCVRRNKNIGILEFLSGMRPACMRVDGSLNMQHKIDLAPGEGHTGAKKA